MKKEDIYPETGWLKEVRKEIIRLFDESDKSKSDNNAKTDGRVKWLPDTDVVEKHDKFIIHVDLPGVKSGEISVTANEDQLTVSGKRHARDDSFLYKESYSGAFTRSIHLRSRIEPGKIKNSMINGVLTIRVPKVNKSKYQTE